MSNRISDSAIRNPLFGSFSKRTLRTAERDEEGEGACPDFGSSSKTTLEQSCFTKGSKIGGLQSSFEKRSKMERVLDADSKPTDPKTKTSEVP